MAQRPLVDRLPLGVRAVRTVTAPVAAPPAPATARKPDLPALVAEARRLSDTLQPNAVEAWAAVARAAEGIELDPRDRAEIADHEAMDLGPAGLELFERAAELYAEAGDPGEALAARARAAYVRALEGEVDEALAAVAGPYDEVLALYSVDGTGVRQTASVLMSRARILMRRVHEGDDEAFLTEAESAVREVLALVEGRTGDDMRLAARVAEAQAMLAELAARAGDVRGRRSCSCAPRRGSWRRDCRGSRWSTRPGWPGSCTTWATWPGRNGRCGRPWSTAGRTWRRSDGPSCVSSSPRSSAAGEGPRRPPSTPWRPLTGPTRPERDRRWARWPGTSWAGSCCVSAGGPRPRRCWSQRCPT